MAELAKTPEEVAKENDLLPKLIQHLDRHLIFPLLQFVADQGEEPAPETTKAKYELLKKTNMTDYVADLYCELEGVNEPPKEFATKRQEVLDRLEVYAQESEKITDLLGREDVVTSLRSDKVANLEFLKKEHDVRFKPTDWWVLLIRNRSPSRWLMSCMTLATSSTAVETTKQQPNFYTNSESCPRTTIKSLLQHGESWRPKS
jgi:eIF3 subunit 6 N terminal domain